MYAKEIVAGIERDSVMLAAVDVHQAPIHPALTRVWVSKEVHTSLGWLRKELKEPNQDEKILVCINNNTINS